MVDHGGASYRFRWDDPGLGWSDENEVSVNLVQSDQNTPALGAPNISGTVQVDETLTADTTGVEDADGLTNVSYSYQWIPKRREQRHEHCGRDGRGLHAHRRRLR